jgi:hypothetical protein
VLRVGPTAPYSSINNMELISMVEQLHTSAQSVRTELVSTQIAADPSPLRTVMGPACYHAGTYGEGELTQVIQNDVSLDESLQGFGGETISEIRHAVFELMTGYATRVATAVFDAQFTEWETLVRSKLINRLGFSISHIDGMLNSLGEIKHQATRLQSLSLNSGPSDKVFQEYKANLKFVCAVAAQLLQYDTEINKRSKAIADSMFSVDVGARERVREHQDLRESMVKERRVVEHNLITHFDSGSTQDRGGVKINLKDFKVPEGLEKGRGLELIQSLNAFLKNRAPQYYAIMSDLIRVMAESKMGKFYKPASGRGGYQEVDSDIRSAYSLQSKELYDEICLKVPRKLMNDIRVTFKYGLEELPAVCEVGDGVTAVFCLLALHRPASLVYRDSLRTQLEEGSHKFKDGTNPGAKIKELRAVILEAIDLSVKVSWRLTGKGIVTVMSERGNNFAQVLSKYNTLGGIVDPEDCVVELNRMFTDIEEVINQMEIAGIDIKRVMAVRVMSLEKDKKPKAGSNPALCWYADGCTRTDCSFTHESGAKKEKKGKGKGKGSKGKGDGKSKGKGGKGGKGESKNDICKAKGCTGPSRGWPLCNTCRREGLEKGSMTLKDGSKMPVTAAEKKVPEVSTEKRLEQLEKQIHAAKSTREDSDGDDLELFTGGAPKCVKLAAISKKRERELNIHTASVFERMQPSYKRRSTEQELDEEFNDE